MAFGLNSIKFQIRVSLSLRLVAGGGIEPPTFGL